MSELLDNMRVTVVIGDFAAAFPADGEDDEFCCMECDYGYCDG